MQLHHTRLGLSNILTVADHPGPAARVRFACLARDGGNSIDLLQELGVVLWVAHVTSRVSVIQPMTVEYKSHDPHVIED